jgi:uncharacterized membrane protein YedE/YeeE
MAATGNAFARSEALTADVEAAAAVDDVRVPAVAEWFAYLGIGIVLGILFVKSQVLSWYRIQEMFRFQSFHLYGVMASGIAVGAASIALIKKLNIKTFSGEPIQFPKKKFHKGNIFGGLLFGFGWAMTGACPGPLYALVGTATIMIVPLLSALAGTWVYGLIREKLPH